MNVAALAPAVLMTSPATLRDTLETFLSAVQCAEATRANHRDFAAYLTRYFGADRPIGDFAGEAGGKLVGEYLANETGGRDRGLRERFGGPGNLRRALSYTSVRQRLVTLRHALQASHARGELAAMPEPWPIPPRGSHGHLDRGRYLLRHEKVAAELRRPLAKRTYRKAMERAPGADQTPPEGTVTLADAAGWALEATKQRRTAATLTLYTQSWEHVERYFGGGRPVADFAGPAGYRLIKAFVDSETARGVKNVTSKKRLIVVRLAFKEATRRGALPGMPPWPDFAFDGEPRTRYLTYEEYLAIRTTMPMDLCSLVDLGAWTGQHRSDLFTMTWGMVDLGGGPGAGPGPGLALWLRRNGKNKTRVAWLPMPDELRAHLTAEWRRRGRPQAAETICPAIDYAGWRKKLKRACFKAGIAPFALIDLRRTAATWLLEGGGPKDAIRTWLGHSASSAMLERHYAQITPNLQWELVAAMNRKGRGGGAPPAAPAALPPAAPAALPPIEYIGPGRTMS